MYNVLFILHKHSNVFFIVFLSPDIFIINNTISINISIINVIVPNAPPPAGH